MSRLLPCPDCGGTGTRTSERGRSAEECPTCRATGFLYPDPELRGLFRELLRDEHLLLTAGDGVTRRLLLEGLARLEQRVEQLEQALGPDAQGRLRHL
jgi:hypothetical protein